MIGEVLLLKREPENVHDKYAVAVIRQCDNIYYTVGHIPYNLTPIVSQYLARDRSCRGNRAKS